MHRRCVCEDIVVQDKPGRERRVKADGDHGSQGDARAGRAGVPTRRGMPNAMGRVGLPRSGGWLPTATRVASQPPAAVDAHASLSCLTACRGFYKQRRRGQPGDAVVRRGKTAPVGPEPVAAAACARRYGSPCAAARRSPRCCGPCCGNRREDCRADGDGGALRVREGPGVSFGAGSPAGGHAIRRSPGVMHRAPQCRRLVRSARRRWRTR